MLNKLKHWLFTFNLTVLLVFNLFFIIVAVLAAVAAAVLIGSQLGLVDWTRLLTPAAVSILIYAIAILIGISMVVMIQKVILNPVRSMVGAMQRLATGDFSVRMTCQGWMRPLELREFTAAFNTAAEELGHTETVFHAGWPTYDEEAMKDDEVEIAVQINGKTRAVVALPADVSKEDAIAKGKEAVQDKLTGTIVKEIYVPGRIINIVQK